MHWLQILCCLSATITYIATMLPMFRSALAPLRHVDKDEKDLFFDRVVSPLLADANYSGNGKKFTIYSTGVLIANDRVLTSYNPFRNSIKSQFLLSKTGVCFLTHRSVNITRLTYKYDCEITACGRQVIPMVDKDLTDDQWHGPEKKLSPVHDLMILKLAKALNIWEGPDPSQSTYETKYTEATAGIFLKAGPLITKLADKDDIIKGSIKFAALGLKNAKWFNFIQVAYYDDYEDGIVKCNEWLPKNWGHFICVRNEFTAGFGSGALLFSEDKLFGVGSFTMFREKESILVFTDVRPYSDLINNTCTENDLKIN